MKILTKELFYWQIYIQIIEQHINFVSDYSSNQNYGTEEKDCLIWMCIRTSTVVIKMKKLVYHMSVILIMVSRSFMAMPPALELFSSAARFAEPLAIVFWMMAAIFFVAWLNTSFIFWVMGCASPRYLAADCAALAYELRLAWYYFRNSCSTAMLW